MGRTRAFCVDDALSKALVVFWRHGFEGTSLTDLTEAMGIARPSLYAAFGNKEQLFRRALDHYNEAYLGFVREALEEPTARKVAERLLQGFALTATDTRHPPGCLITNSALACSAAADSIRDELVARRTAFETALRTRLEQAKATGDLGADAEPEDLARFIVTIGGGMAVQATAGATRQSLERLAATALKAWPS